MRKHLLLFLLVSTTSTYSQINRYYGFDDFNYNENGSILALDGDFNLNATSISNQLIFADFIDTDLKDKNGDKHNSDKNRIGYDLEFNMCFRQKREKFLGLSDAGYFIGIKTRNHRDVVYNKNFYNLLLYGNKPYLGETLKMNGSLNLLTYEQFQLGFFKAFVSETKTVTGGLGLSFVKGTNGLNIELKEGTNLFTELNAEYIDFNMDGSLNYTDPSKKSIGDMNGIGFSSSISNH